jgi:hypothetical protein
MFGYRIRSILEAAVLKRRSIAGPLYLGPDTQLSSFYLHLKYYRNRIFDFIGFFQRGNTSATTAGCPVGESLLVKYPRGD